MDRILNVRRAGEIGGRAECFVLLALACVTIDAFFRGETGADLFTTLAGFFLVCALCVLLCAAALFARFILLRTFVANTWRWFLPLFLADFTFAEWGGGNAILPETLERFFHLWKLTLAVRWLCLWPIQSFTLRYEGVPGENAMHSAPGSQAFPSFGYNGSRGGRFWGSRFLHEGFGGFRADFERRGKSYAASEAVCVKNPSGGARRL